MQAILYGLYSSRDRVIRYVGQTQVSAWRRYEAHIRDAKRSGSQARVYQWIRSEWADGHTIHGKILKSKAEWNDDELVEIARIKPDANTYAGGTWVNSDPAVVRRKIGDGVAGFARVRSRAESSYWKRVTA